MYELDSTTKKRNTISILIASLREQELLKRLEEFDSINIEVNYEIVVCSPYKVEHPKVAWVEETERKGNVAAMQLAFEHSSGNYIIFWADDVSPTPQCIDNMFRFVRERTEPFLGSFVMLNDTGEEQRHWYIQDKMYSCYGCISRKHIEEVGGFFDTSFIHSWCDPDLSLRAWMNNGRVEKCATAKVINRQISDLIHSENSILYFKRDTKTFLNKWGIKLNIAPDSAWGSFNKGHLTVDDNITALKKNKYFVTPYNLKHKPLVSFLLSCRVFSTDEFNSCPLNMASTKKFNLYTLLNTLCTFPQKELGNKIEILIKIDEDDELAFNEYIDQNKLIEKYPTLILRPIIYNRWEGRNSLYQDYWFMFTRKNPFSKFVGVLSDDGYVYRNVIRDIENNLSKKYSVFTSHVSSVFETLTNWKEAICKYTDGTLTEPYPIISTNLLEIMGNTGFQNNIDSSITAILIIMKCKYGIDLRIPISGWIMRGNKNAPSNGFHSKFNEDFCIAIDQFPKEDSYFWKLIEQQTDNLYLTMTRKNG